MNSKSLPRRRTGLLHVCALALSLLLPCGKPLAETIHIGVIAPLTGVRSDAGNYMRSALTLLKDKLNTDANRKYAIEFLFEDSKYEPLAAVNAFRKLVDVDRVRFIVGPYASSETVAIAPLANAEGVIMLTPGAQVAGITRAGGNVFRLIHNSAQEAPRFAAYLAADPSILKIFFLVADNPASSLYVPLFREEFQKHQRAAGEVEKFPPTETDYRPYLTRLKTKGASHIFLIAAPAQVPLILQQARQVRLNARFFNVGVEGPELFSHGPELVEGLLYPYSYDTDSRQEEVQAFRNQYEKKYGNEPDAVAANTYDAAMLLVACVERVGASVQKVNACLHETKNYRGASGTLEIDTEGNAVKQLFVKKSAWRQSRKDCGPVNGSRQELVDAHFFEKCGYGQSLRLKSSIIVALCARTMRRLCFSAISVTGLASPSV